MNINFIIGTMIGIFLSLIVIAIKNKCIHRKYRYFMYYKFKTKDNRTGCGNFDITIYKKIKTIDDIREIAGIVLKDDSEFENVVITNFIRL